MEENFDFMVAASGYTYNIESYYEIVKKDRNKKFINIQLRQWIEALRRFEQLDEEDFTIEEAVLTIQSLCSSLETLGGITIETTDNAPSLIAIFKYTLKKEKGWDLSSEKSNLFALLEEMDNINKNIVKHITKAQSRKELLKTINYNKLREYMRTTKAIWIWMLNKIHKGNISEQQLRFFKKEF